MLCKVLEIELKTYTPIGWKSVFQKIKFKVLQVSISSTSSYLKSSYFQWFTRYSNHVDLLMSHVHALKKLF